jgi:hypothetical protein
VGKNITAPLKSQEAIFLELFINLAAVFSYPNFEYQGRANAEVSEDKCVDV